MPTPQEKKQQSLKHDCRNCYGENDKSSRKSIRRRKAMVNRSFRRKVRQSLLDSIDDPDSLNGNVNSVGRTDWKKAPDKPLGEHLRNELVSEIIDRVRVASRSNERFLDVLEAQLTDTNMPPQALQVIMRQLRGIVLARWSTSVDIDYDTARVIADTLNRIEP